MRQPIRWLRTVIWTALIEPEKRIIRSIPGSLGKPMVKRSVEILGGRAVTTGFAGRVATVNQAAASGIYLASYYLGGLVGSLVLGQVFKHLSRTTCVLSVAAAIAAPRFLVVHITIAPSKTRPVHATT